VGIRLNRGPPNITLTRKKTGGIHVSKSPSVTLTHVDEQMVKRILAVRVAALSTADVHGRTGSLHPAAVPMHVTRSQKAKTENWSLAAAAIWPWLLIAGLHAQVIAALHP